MDRVFDYCWFFDSWGLCDKNVFKKVIDLVCIGECLFEFNDMLFFFGVWCEEVNEKIIGIFSVDE